MVWDHEELDFDCETWHCLVEMGRHGRNGQVSRRCNGLER